MLVQYTIISYWLFIGACVLSLAFGSHSYVIAMDECIKENLCAISQNLQDETKQNQILEQLIEFVEFHSRVKQLSSFDE